MDTFTQHSWLNPKILIMDTPQKGKGMFAQGAIAEGERVLTWGGEYTNAEGAGRARTDGKLVIQWDVDLFSVEERGKDDGYFINHSCDANTWMSDAYTLIARRDIERNKEVTADYALWEADSAYVAKWVCQCGSPFCRKTITGDDWRSMDVQDRYRGHFSPLINKKITHEYGSDR